MLAVRMRRLWPKTVPFRLYSGAKGANGCSDIPEEVMEELEKGFLNMCYSDSRSLLKKHLNRDLFDKLKTKTTPTYHSTLLDCIRSGLKNYNSHVGIYAPDPEAYCTFADIFNPIIEDYHGFKKGEKHPPSCFGYGADFPDLDPERKFIVSTRVRCGRSLKNFPFNPCLTQCDYAQLQAMITKALGNLCGDHAGKYFPLCAMKPEAKQKLINKHYLFKEDDPFLEQANAFRFWPLGRGIFINRSRTFIVWVNEEDHIRVISMEKGGNLGRVYERMIIGVESLAHQLQFAHDPRLGYLTFCPTNLGTSVRASVHIKLPSMGEDQRALEDVAEKYHLQVRGTRGEHTEVVGGVYDVSNQRRMGLTEYQAITEMYNGILALINAECERETVKANLEKAAAAKLATKVEEKVEEPIVLKRKKDKCKPKSKTEESKCDKPKSNAEKDKSKEKGTPKKKPDDSKCKSMCKKPEESKSNGKSQPKKK